MRRLKFVLPALIARDAIDRDARSGTAALLELGHKRESSWLWQAVFALDRWLRRRQGIYEFCSRSDCLFRLERGRAERPVALSDGASARAGDPVLKLHLWNEHVPPMGRRGPTVGWARHASRAIEGSLCELAQYLSRHAEFANVRLLYGDMCLGSARQTRQFKRVIGRYGFEVLDLRPHGTLHRLGDMLLVLLLGLATNPVALRRAPLRRYRQRVYLSRAVLERRYLTRRNRASFSRRRYGSR
ncbi:MAG: YkoP family protein [Steroidobacteraceae bacterium]